MARAAYSDALREACPDFAEIKARMSFDTPVSRENQAAATHALWCETCKPIVKRIQDERFGEVRKLFGIGEQT